MSEFIRRASQTAKPLITVNWWGWNNPVNKDDYYPERGMREAANWVEYCNAAVDQATIDVAIAESWAPSRFVDPSHVDDPDPLEDMSATAEEWADSWKDDENPPLQRTCWRSWEDAPDGYFAWLRRYFQWKRPTTYGGKGEAGEKLSIAGHLRRDPSLVRLAYPRHEALWGLAELSRTDLAQIEQIAGVPVDAPEGFVTADTIIAALTLVMERDGVDRMLEVSERLLDLGLQVVKESGASLSPFVGESLHRPEMPAGDDPKEWEKYSAAIEEALGAWTDFGSSYLGPQMLAVKSRARGNMRWMVRLVGSTGVETDINGAQVPIRHGLAEGLSAEDVFALVPSAREGLGEIAIETLRGAYGVRESEEPRGFNVLDRAMRAKYPGIVFADAAANEEVDPLTSIDARLFVGLPV